MTRPDWCPPDVWDSTADVDTPALGHSADLAFTVRCLAAKAAHNERQRCADIAELAAVRAALYGADAVNRVCTEVHRAIQQGHIAA